MSRVEVLTGPERRRRQSTEQKRLIVAEAFAPGASVCAVARRRDVVPGTDLSVAERLRSAVAGAYRGGGRAGGERAIDGVAPAVEIELGRDVGVRITATAPEELASAIIKALAAR